MSPLNRARISATSNETSPSSSKSIEYSLVAISRRASVGESSAVAFVLCESSRSSDSIACDSGAWGSIIRYEPQSCIRNHFDFFGVFLATVFFVIFLTVAFSRAVFLGFADSSFVASFRDCFWPVLLAAFLGGVAARVSGSTLF